MKCCTVQKPTALLLHRGNENVTLKYSSEMARCLLLFLLVIILVMAVRDLLRRRGEEVRRLDLTDGAGQLVPFALLLQVQLVTVPCCQGRLGVHDADVSVLHCRLMRHQDMCCSEQVAEGVVQQINKGGSIKVSVTHHLRCK